MSELELAALLRKTIQDSGKTLAEIRAGSGVSEPQVSRFMREERSISMDAIERLLRYFKLRVISDQDLPEGKPKPAPKKPAAKAKKK